MEAPDRCPEKLCERCSDGYRVVCRWQVWIVLLANCGCFFWHLHPTGGFLTRLSFNPSFKASLNPEDVRDEKVKAWST